MWGDIQTHPCGVHGELWTRMAGPNPHESEELSACCIPGTGLRRLPAEEARLQLGASVCLYLAGGRQVVRPLCADSMGFRWGGDRWPVCRVKRQPAPRAVQNGRRPVVTGGHVMDRQAALDGPRAQPALSVPGEGSDVGEDPTSGWAYRVAQKAPARTPFPPSHCAGQGPGKNPAER